MNVSYELFLRWKAAKGFRSDREAASGLRISHGTPNSWKAGKNASPELIEKMAKDLGENPEPLVMAAIADQHMGKNREILLRLSKRLTTVAATIALTVGAVGNSYGINGIAEGSSHNRMYIMSGNRRWSLSAQSSHRRRRLARIAAGGTGPWTIQQSRRAFA